MTAQEIATRIELLGEVLATDPRDDLRWRYERLKASELDRLYKLILRGR